MLYHWNFIEVNWNYKLELICISRTLHVWVCNLISQLLLLFFQSAVWVYSSSCSTCWYMLNKYQIQHIRLPSNILSLVRLGKSKEPSLIWIGCLTLLLVGNDFQWVEIFYFNYCRSISRNIILNCFCKLFYGIYLCLCSLSQKMIWLLYIRLNIFNGNTSFLLRQLLFAC